MKPTATLRFLQRTETYDTGQITIPDGLKFMGTRRVYVLQQWWEDPNVILAVHLVDQEGNTLPPPKRGEWRDVPLEVEQ